MRIVMYTNTYLPHVGGVARSVSTYEEEFRRRIATLLCIAACRSSSEIWSYSLTVSPLAGLMTAYLLILLLPFLGF